MEKSFLEKTLVQNQQGFSLIEILIALTIMVGAGAFVAGKLSDNLQEGKQNSTRIQMNSLDGRLKDFRRRCGFYPTSEQGLEALLTKPTGGRECKDYPVNGFIEGDALPKDAWDNDFQYVSDGKTFNIISFGNDGQEGGEEFDADISFKKGKDASGGGPATGQTGGGEAAPAE